MPRFAFHDGCSVLAIAAPLALAWTSPAIAQETVEGANPAAATQEKLVYVPADFAQYAPKSALDMLAQLPGFSIQESQGQGRGLGEATGNVLVNGERLTSKSDTVTQRLGRISATSVVRIELVDGATLDIPGLSGRVANVVTADSADASGQFEWNPQLATDWAKLRWAALQVSVTGNNGPVGWTIGFDNDPFHGGTGGPNFITDGAGVTTEYFTRTQSIAPNPKLSTQLAFNLPGSAVANLSAFYQWTWNNAMEDEFAVVPAGMPSRFERIRTEEDGHTYEINGDIEFELGPGRLKLIALDSGDTSDFATQSVIDPDTGAPSFGSRFTNRSKSGERIGRAEYKWKLLGGDWQLSGEGAFNRLKTVAVLAFLRPSGEFVAVPFPSGTGGVTEDRYESILSFGRPITSNLSVQASAGGEYSKISQTGSNALSRTFTRPKGSLSIAWEPIEGLDIAFEAARKVGQLDFGDFLAQVNLSNDNVNSGNNELRPEQSWEFDLEFVKDFGAWGSMTLHFFDNYIEDFIDVVPLPGGGESVGNIEGQARVHGVSYTGTIRLDPMGLRGARLDIDAVLRKSKVIDPVTGEAHGFSNLQSGNVNVEFRHDVPGTDIAWGAGVRTTDFNPYYRVAEFGFDYNQVTSLRVFVEHKDVFGLTVQARLNNILEKDAILNRYVYAGPRGTSPLLFHEDRRREIGRIVNFTVKGNF